MAENTGAQRILVNDLRSTQRKITRNSRQTSPGAVEGIASMLDSRIKMTKDYVDKTIGYF